jgi:uncharacterized Tic20 family protein
MTYPSAPEPSDPASTPPAHRAPSDFGAGAFEAMPPASEPPPPEPATPVEPAPHVPPADPQAAPRESTHVPPPEPHAAPRVEPEPVAPAPHVPPIAAASPTPPPQPPRKPEKVHAVPMTKFERPAPTIDVEGHRVAPPPPPSAGQPPPGPTSSAPPDAGAAPGPQPAAEPRAASVDASSRWWSVFSHLFLLPALVTFFVGSLCTLLVWLLAGKEDPLVEDQGREALNFQLNVALLSVLLFVSCLGSVLIPLLWLGAVALCIVAAVHASRGERYRYPLILRLVRG